MKFFEYIYVKNNVLRIVVSSSIDSIEVTKLKEKHLNGSVFIVEISEYKEDKFEYAIETGMRLIKIIYRRYFLKNKYTYMLKDEILYKTIKEVANEYAERAEELT